MTKRYDDEVEANIGKLQGILRSAPQGSVVFFGGAGVSTESGIPDFRSPDGLYAQKFDYPPETMLSRTFYDRRTKAFFDFYYDRVLFLGAQPNRAHRKLAQLEAEGKLSAVITQNIDGLHQAAGSRNVLELHGSIMRNYCTGCGRFFDGPAMLELREAALSGGGDGVPRCPDCGRVVKPDVVLYEEPLDGRILQESLRAIQAADTLVIAGTSLVVNPAASLVEYFDGSNLVIVNKSPTPQDHAADLVIPASIGDALDF